MNLPVVVEWADLGHNGRMEKLHLEFVRAAAESARQMRITAAILVRADRDLEEISRAVHSSHIIIARSKERLRLLNGE